MNKTFAIHHAVREDSQQLLLLMRQLAEFEGYANEFAVTQTELEQRLFIKQDFQVLVAHQENQLTAMLVFYLLPFSYDLKPWIYIKELFVVESARGQGVAKCLMTTLAKEAEQIGCSKIRWDVLASNNNAQRFYQNLGAEFNSEWQLFSLDQAAINELAADIKS